MFAMYKASNAVKTSNKVASNVANEAKKAEISNEALETDSSVYVVKSIKRRARNIIDANEREQHERANNKDRNNVILKFKMVNQKRETRYEDNENNVKNKNEQINDERKDDCTQTHELEDVNKAVQEEVVNPPQTDKIYNYTSTVADEFKNNDKDYGYHVNNINDNNTDDILGYCFGGYPDYRSGGFLSSNIIGDCESRQAQVANCAENGNVSSPAIHYRDMSDDQKISPVIGSSSLTLPDYSHLEDVVYSTRLPHIIMQAFAAVHSLTIEQMNIWALAAKYPFHKHFLNTQRPYIDLWAQIAKHLMKELLVGRGGSKAPPTLQTAGLDASNALAASIIKKTQGSKIELQKRWKPAARMKMSIMSSLEMLYRNSSNLPGN
ncbi:9237_t:CDS:2 [Paraglomus brasilianum]|uniref:9237_t:CDS:1 n=1 Tax=Paraglomus brasilianum TaxID=144538 RepID=A0A9N8WMM0_9GLOM|nr:9237_t:CDS:2 [Paraglomus brasilianum]